MNINLNLSEINQILTVLSRQPYIQVHELIHKIQAQATRQLKEQEEKSKEREEVINTDNGQ